MHDTLKWLLDETLHYEKIYLAFSGGQDSTSLLFFLSQCTEIKNKLHALHINHHFSDQSPKWAEHCEMLCEELNITFTCLENTLPITHVSETSARDIRIHLIKKIVTKKDCIITAHHLDDHIETFWIQLIRKNKYPIGIRRKNTLHGITYLRPWIYVTKKNIHQYATDNMLNYVNDPMNHDTTILRNFIRHQWMPKVKKLCKNINKDILGVQQSIQKPYSKIDSNQINIEQLTSPSYRSTDRFISWLHDHKCYDFTYKQCITFIHQLNSQSDKNPSLENKFIKVIRYQNAIYLLRKKTIKPFTLTWAPNQEPNLKLPYSLGVLSMDKTNTHTQITLTVNPYEKLKVHKHKKTFNQAKIPPWARSFYPIITINDQYFIAGVTVSTTSNQFLNKIKFHHQFNKYFFNFE